jgi:threonine dehydratase
MVPAFDDPQVVAGQGTIGLEVLDDLPEVDDVIVPVGGGGLLSGVAIAVKARKPAVRVIGVQAAGAAALVSSLKVGNPVTLPTVQTIADGIAVKRPGDLPFQVIQQYVDDVVTVRDEDILRAIVLLVERAKLVTEGAGAAPLAALLSGAVAARNRHVVLILSGGNIDIKRIGRVLYRGLLPDRLFRQLALAMSGTAAPSLALRAQRSDAEQTTGGNA